MPATSQAQFRAMQAAAHGKSTLGIPAKVGKDFVAATSSPKNLPAKKAGQMSNDAFHMGPAKPSRTPQANPKSTVMDPHQKQARHRVAKAAPLHAKVKAGLAKAFPASPKANAAGTKQTGGY